jgi:hypothetical protein
VIVFRPATMRDAGYVGEHMRPEDAREATIARGGTPRQSIEAAVRLSREAYSIFRVVKGRIEAQPCAVFGVCDIPHSPDTGSVWMLCTPDIARCGGSLLREAPLWLDHVARHYPGGLHAYADARNTLHVRWCECSGFLKLGSAVYRGVTFIHVFREPPTECVTR